MDIWFKHIFIHKTYSILYINDTEIGIMLATLPAYIHIYIYIL